MQKPGTRAKAKAKAKPELKPYHHGDLKSAVLAAAEKILETEGVDALTLRAVARMVGVSHTAPKNHFGDLEGLLSELAAVGYGRFGAALLAAMESAGADPRQRLKAMGLAYVAFARAYPNLFILMYRSDRLDMNSPSLRDAIEEYQAIPEKCDDISRAGRTAAAAATRGPRYGIVGSGAWIRDAAA